MKFNNLKRVCISILLLVLLAWSQIYRISDLPEKPGRCNFRYCSPHKLKGNIVSFQSIYTAHDDSEKLEALMQVSLYAPSNYDIKSPIALVKTQQPMMYHVGMNMTVYHYVSRNDQDQFLDHDMIKTKKNQVEYQFHKEVFALYGMEWIVCLMLVAALMNREPPEN